MTTPGDWRNATPEHVFGRVLRPDEFHRSATYLTAQPDPRLEPWVERYWSVTFALEPGASFHTATIDDASVHLTREHGGVAREGTPGPGIWVTGPETQRRFDVTLTGTGGTLGVAFKTGGTLAFSAGAPHDVVDRSVPGESWFPGVAEAWRELPDAATDAAGDLDAWLLRLQPRADEAYDRFRATLALLDDPAVTRVEQLEQRADCDARTLQRLFHRFAGVGPKWMLTRARVIDAIGLLDRGWSGSLAELAATTGWFDQSHFTRDFRAVTGETPSAYRARLAT